MVMFVYVRGLKGPVPQKWHGKPTNGAGVSPTTLQSTELPDHYADIPLAQLTQLYPFKGDPNS
jgi:hypothetical protein